MKKYILKNLNLVVIVAFAVLVVMPSTAFAAGDVFDTIQSKMISTVKDLRKIAYVIAGFGLVMFSFLAIFNKISFKHLGYIMISLSLLSLMMPFINYFSGVDLQDNELNYEDYIGGGDASIEGSDIESQNDCLATNTCPDDDLSDDLDILTPLDPLDPLETNAEIMNGIDGIDIPDIEDLTTAAEETKSLKEQLKEGIENAKEFVDNVHNTIDAAQDVKAAVETAVEGAQAVKEVLEGDGDFMDKVAGVSSAVGSTATNVASSMGSAMAESGIVSEYLGMDGVSEYLQGASENMYESAGNLNEWTDMGVDAGNIQDSLENAGNRIRGD